MSSEQLYLLLHVLVGFFGVGVFGNVVVEVDDAELIFLLVNLESQDVADDKLRDASIDKD